jgi:ABC-type uncharacterized transport system permease subunit
MSQAENVPPEPPEEAAIERNTIAVSIALKQRAGGIIVPAITVVIAFLMSGIVVLATGHNPLIAYRDIFNGAGLNWIFHPTTDLTSTAAYNLTQTLLQTTTLILTGLAVAFAFRSGMFNIGGQGQYFAGIIVANWLGVEFSSMNPFLHVLLCIVAATLAGAFFAGIAGFLKATVGAHEVITTIMLNWIAIYLASWLFGDGGPLQNSADKTVPISNDIADSAKLPDFWGQQILQGLHIGIFIALAALVVYWAILNRTTLGYEVRAVGFNPESAAYGGINVKKNLIRAMAISGAFAGLAGAMDMLGYLYHYAQSDIAFSSVGFLGIAVALLGRNTAVGVGLSALLFGALLFGTTHGLTSSVIKPELAGNLTYIIQGLIVLFIGADLLILAVWNSRRKLRRPGHPKVTTSEAAA